MIVQLRLDERLIHGQITTAWSRYLDVSAIVVVSDRLAEDKLATQVLLMSAPAGKKVAVKSVESAIKLLSDPRSENMRILVIVDNPADAVKLRAALPIDEVNVANYVKKKSPNKVQLTRGCNADPEDLGYFRKLVDQGGHVFSQLIPSQQAVDFAKVVREAETKQQS